MKSILLILVLSLSSILAHAEESKSTDKGKPLVLPDLTGAMETAKAKESKSKVNVDVQCTDNTSMQNIKSGQPGFDNCVANSKRAEDAKRK